MLRLNSGPRGSSGRNNSNHSTDGFHRENSNSRRRRRNSWREATNNDARKFGTDEERSLPVLQVFTKFYTQVYLGKFPNSKGKAINLSGLQVKRTRKENHIGTQLCCTEN